MNGSFVEDEERCVLDCTGNPPILNIDNNLTNCAGTRSGELCPVTCLEGYFSPYPSVCYNNTWELRDENGDYIFYPQYVVCVRHSKITLTSTNTTTDTATKTVCQIQSFRT